jgi:hypothetical protein
MSKKKSLGSSPIGFSSLGVDSFEFIPSIDIATTQSAEADSSIEDRENGYRCGKKYDELFTDRSTKQNIDTEEKVEKKIVSYYLEEELVDRLKRVADEKKMYYSTLVSNAIYYWLDNNSY